jgi:hypothetical protein
VEADLESLTNEWKADLGSLTDDLDRLKHKVKADLRSIIIELIAELGSLVKCSSVLTFPSAYTTISISTGHMSTPPRL